MGMKVYPRVCGGTIPAHCSIRRGGGLSPRMRGNRIRRKPELRRYGSIPAYAGEPATPDLPPDALLVYPRVCGGTGFEV